MKKILCGILAVVSLVLLSQESMAREFNSPVVQPQTTTESTTSTTTSSDQQSMNNPLLHVGVVLRVVSCKENVDLTLFTSARQPVCLSV